MAAGLAEQGSVGLLAALPSLRPFKQSQKDNLEIAACSVQGRQLSSAAVPDKGAMPLPPRYVAIPRLDFCRPQELMITRVTGDCMEVPTLQLVMGTRASS